MSDKLIIVNKKVGQTPLDCIKQVKINNPILVDLPITYAGRLDPLAEGVLLLLVGDECHKKDKYLALSKEYEVTILFGFETDTYDVMGKVKGINLPENELFEKSSTNLLAKTFSNFTGYFSQPYPPYSSRTVEGKPLFQWAREERLGEIEIPSHDVFVEEIKILEESFIRGSELLNKIKNDIGKVKGDFRQEEILIIWNDKLKDKYENKFKIIKLKISCGSGVYVRCIAHDIGKAMGVPALALDIKRTKIGEYCG